MPTATNLPTMVLIYFEALEQLSGALNGVDSNSPEATQIMDEKLHYLCLIRHELAEMKKSEET